MFTRFVSAWNWVLKKVSMAAMFAQWSTWVFAAHARGQYEFVYPSSYCGVLGCGDNQTMNLTHISHSKKKIKMSNEVPSHRHV